MLHSFVSNLGADDDKLVLVGETPFLSCKFCSSFYALSSEGGHSKITGIVKAGLSVLTCSYQSNSKWEIPFLLR